MFDAQSLAQAVKDGKVSEQEARKQLVRMYQHFRVFPKIMEAFSRFLIS
jgi:hypothetical protein